MKQYKKIETKILKDTLTNIICDNCQSDIILNDKFYYEMYIEKGRNCEDLSFQDLQFCSYGCVLNALESFDIGNNNEIISVEICKEKL